jgi:hypothetical protein
MIARVLVYIFGPYRAATPSEILDNIRNAEFVARELARNGVDFVCPHLNARLFDGVVEDDQFWLDMDINIMRRCDCLVGVKGWENSEGSKVEIVIAKSLGMPVYLSCEEFLKDYRRSRDEGDKDA